MSRVLKTISEIARSKAGGGTPTIFHWLYGFTMLQRMAPEALEKMFPEEAERKEIELIRGILEKEDLDLELIRLGTALIPAVQQGEALAFTPSEEGKEDSKDSAEVLETLLKENHEAISEMFHKGNTMQDIVRLKNKYMPPKPEKASEEKTKVSDAGNTPKEGKPVSSEPVPSVQGSAAGSVAEAAAAKGPGQAEADAERSLKEESFRDHVLRSRKLEARLKEVVKGQEVAIGAFVKSVFRTEADVRMGNGNGFWGIYLFAGPHCVGKSLTAEAAVKAWKLPALRFSAGAFAEIPAQILPVDGNPVSVPANFDSVSGFIKQNPRCVLIFDELEEGGGAEAQILERLFQVRSMMNGHLDDNTTLEGVTIIVTTAYGESFFLEQESKNLSLLDPVLVKEALTRKPDNMSPGIAAITNYAARCQMENIIVFNNLAGREILAAGEKAFDDGAASMQERLGCEVEYTEEVSTLFQLSKPEELDIREIAAMGQSFMQDELYDFFRQGEAGLGLDRLEKVRFCADWEVAGKDVRELFHRNEAVFVLYFGGEEPFLKETERGVCFLSTDDLADFDSLLGKQAVSFVLIDPAWGVAESSKGVSMDDWDSDGIRCFRHLQEVFPQCPCYFLNRAACVREIDKLTMMSQGVRGLISYDPAHPGQMVEEAARIADGEATFEIRRDLARLHRAVVYNTAQRISPDGKVATIEFYDLKIRQMEVAANGEDPVGKVEKPDTRFADVIGADTAKKELQYFVDILQNPKASIMKGERPPRGILLYGPPGTGKTLLARAMAGEAKATFRAVSATEFMEKYVGDGPKKIRSLFAEAKKNAPAIIFIDEIDAIAKERTGSDTTHYTEELLNTLMTEMDGFERVDPRRPVFVIAATNFALERSSSRGGVIIDPALQRRFENKIKVDLPDKDARVRFLKTRLSKIENEVTEDAVNSLANRTMGQSLAHLENVLSLAKRNAIRKNVKLDDAVLQNAFDEYRYGDEHKMNEDYYRATAHHEAGHAYVYFLSGHTPSYVTIVSRGNFGGYMMRSEEEADTPSWTKEELLWNIRVSLAGRASEIVFYGENAGINTGVSSDLEHATNTAVVMLSRYGMAEDTMISVDMNQVLNSAYGQKVLDKADAVLKQEMQATIQLIRDGKDKVEALASALIDKNQLSGDEIKRILEKTEA